MKLIDGKSLHENLAKLAGDFRSAARAIARAADAVHHAHQRAILHRDLKPHNILIDSRGDGYVTDFGLAKRVAAGSDFTHSGAILGTPAYMAPEQAASRRGSITTAVDVYGLGASLYAILAQRAPFGGESIEETLRQVREQAPEPTTKIDPRVPRDLEVICLKCLEKEPRQRYPSAEAVRDELRRYYEGLPVKSRPINPAERFWRWCKRRRVLAAVSFAAASLAVVLFAASNVAAWTFRTQPNALLIEQGKTSRAEQRLRVQLQRTQRAEREARAAESAARTERDRAIGAKKEAQANLIEATKQERIASQSEAEAQSNLARAQAGEQRAKEAEAHSKAILEFVEAKIPSEVA
jgi:serine/threonine protein kinase